MSAAVAHVATSPDAAALLVNTGTPSAPRSAEVRQFLRRFLSDPRVVELPRSLWLPLLHGVVLPLRSPRSARKYRRIWLNEGSPLLINNSRLRDALARELAPLRSSMLVEQAFLYSSPSVPQLLQQFRQAGIRRLLILPLYPQSSGSTTGAVYDQVAGALRTWRAMPELRFIENYCSDSGYISALANSLTEHWRDQPRSEHLLMSFHGLPQSFITAGDRYAEECHRSAAQLAAALDLAPADWSLSFQSRFGANRWLTPATDHSLAELARRGVRSLSVLCPGFAVDCLETLEEIAIEGRERFLAAGGERYEYIPALNARADHAAALARLLIQRSSDWS